MKIDKDLMSIQEVRDLVQKAKHAQAQFADYSSEQIDKIIEGLAKEGMEHAERLARMANEETGFGKWEDKKVKNELASQGVWEYIKDMKTVGIISDDKESGIVEIASPMGVIAGIVPSTNPTSTVIYKSLISLKSGNSIVFSPHPSAAKCILETAKVLQDAASKLGAPDNIINCVSIPTLGGTNELIKSVDMILATGGSAMVKAAYSSGVPALGVGPGNVPAFIERSADVKDAVSKIFESKTFDYGTVCASEQAIVTEKCIEDEVRSEVTKNGGYFLRGTDLEKVKLIMERPNGGMNPDIVGRSAQYIAKLANISIPSGTKILLSDEAGIGPKHPFSKEKLTQLLGFYVVNDWKDGCETCYKLLQNGGVGHSLAIHSKDETIIRAFALKKPVSRFLVNTPSTHGAVGISTNLAPSFTLGCGTAGGSATSDNVTPENLINKRRMAYGVKDYNQNENADNCSDPQVDIESICRMVMEQLNK